MQRLSVLSDTAMNRHRKTIELRCRTSSVEEIRAWGSTLQPGGLCPCEIHLCLFMQLISVRHDAATCGARWQFRSSLACSPSGPCSISSRYMEQVACLSLTRFCRSGSFSVGYAAVLIVSPWCIGMPLSIYVILCGAGFLHTGVSSSHHQSISSDQISGSRVEDRVLT